MTFYGYGSIWDPRVRRIVAVFRNGTLSTDDERVMELARLAGFAEERAPEAGIEHEPLPRVPVPEPPRPQRRRRK